MRTIPMTLALSVLTLQAVSLDVAGLAYAVASGTLASGLGYALWYRVLPQLKATTAASVQLSVPVLAAIGGVIVLSEPITTRLAVASVAILGGIGLVIWQKKAQSNAPK